MGSNWGLSCLQDRQGLKQELPKVWICGDRYGGDGPAFDDLQLTAPEPLCGKLPEDCPEAPRESSSRNADSSLRVIPSVCTEGGGRTSVPPKIRLLHLKVLPDVPLRNQRPRSYHQDQGIWSPGHWRSCQED